MVSSLSPVVSNIFMEYFETLALDTVQQNVFIMALILQ